jgi:hypothetical protein
MACPWVADGGDGLKVWSVTPNTLNKHLPKAGKGWSSSLGVGRGACTMQLPLKYCTVSWTSMDCDDDLRQRKMSMTGCIWLGTGTSGGFL